MKELFIIYERYYDFEQDKVLTGGVQTYLTNLIPLFFDNGYKITLFQFGYDFQKKDFEKFQVISAPKTKKKNRYDIKSIIHYIKKNYDMSSAVLLFGDSNLNYKSGAKYTISIQHGIWWDIPRKKRFPDIIMAIYSSYRTYFEHHRLKFVDKLICVDYNFPNWYKAQVDMPNCDLVVIPNFAKISPPFERHNSENINIIFARRLVPHRGTRVFAEAISKILLENNNVIVTVAGRGPDEQYLHSKLDIFAEKVIFTQYSSEQSMSIHLKQDIAIIPTVGSEGTSLSLLEAMATSCAVICTAVGGMTNIVLDGFNGLMIEWGNSNELYKAIKKLIENREQRKLLGNNARKTVESSFSYDKWKEKWVQIIKGLEK